RTTRVSPFCCTKVSAELGRVEDRPPTAKIPSRSNTARERRTMGPPFPSFSVRPNGPRNLRVGAGLAASARPRDGMDRPVHAGVRRHHHACAQNVEPESLLQLVGSRRAIATLERARLDGGKLSQGFGCGSPDHAFILAGTGERLLHCPGPFEAVPSQILVAVLVDGFAQVHASVLALDRAKHANAAEGDHVEGAARRVAG